MRASEIPTAALVLGTQLPHPSLFRAFILHFCGKNLFKLTISALGVNVPDHDMTFQSLSELLRQSVTPFVASVQAKECGGNDLNVGDKPVHGCWCIQVCLFFFFNSALKHLMKKVLERLMDTDVALDDDEEEVDGEQKPLCNSVHCSLTTLCDWYISKTKVRP